jgi:hypothetical protein
MPDKIRKTNIWLSTLLLIICSFSFSCQKRAAGGSYAEVLNIFSNPPAEFRSMPLWVWNDRVTNQQIEMQLADFKAQGIGGVFIHPRPGLITPYLSEEWFSLCRHAVDVGKSLGLKIWIYDENSYPSGFAGGHVPADMPDSVGLGLRLTKAAMIPASFDQRPLVVLRKSDSGFENITEQATQPGANASLGVGEYFIFDIQKASPSPWFAGFTYVDLMRRDVTEKFLDITLNSYKRAIGEEFGATVPGSFQDEAHVGPVLAKNTINFTPALFDKFQKKWGYDLRVHLPSLFEETGDWPAVRHNYYATLLDLFIEGWAKPYYDYCAANNLWLTGHYLEHEWPFPSFTPDYLAMDAWAHMPGIDCLMNQWEAGPHAQFGNARPPKEIRSAANQLGRRRTMSETYGAGGWDLQFVDQKRIADWEFALGVNFITQHLSYITIMGARKRDHPQSFSYHEPWWHAYKVMGDYLGRLSAAMSSGEQQNRILVLEPTTTAWMYYSPGAPSERLKALEEHFTNFINRLEAEQVEYDLGSEDILKNHGRAENKRMVVGERTYDVVVLPPGVENLNQTSLELLSRYLEAGGQVLSCVRPPRFVNAKESEQPGKIAQTYPQNWLVRSEGEEVNKLVETCAREIQFAGLNGDKTMFFHHRRQLADAELVFLANVNPERAMSGEFTGRGRSVEKWDPSTGKALNFPAEVKNGRARVKFDVPPAGSLLLCLQNGKSTLKPEQEFKGEANRVRRDIEIKRLSPNVLTLDYCDLRLDGKLEKDIYFYAAQRKTFQHHGLDRNPWDRAVQYKTNILDLDKFLPNSGFEADFWFEADAGVDLASLQVVVERPQLYHTFVNGREVNPDPEKWWLDRSFGVFDIGSSAKTGKNRITLKASPFTIHIELEPVYLLGDFCLANQEKGFKLVANQALKPGAWSEQGLPFYAGGIGYTMTFGMLGKDELNKYRYGVELVNWRGSVAEVKVNDKRAGFIAYPPFQLDISNLLEERRDNKITVIVYGTLKNTLGPHHNNPPLGMAWPSMFQKGAEGGRPPGSKYSVVGYGLFEGFWIVVQGKD